MKKLFSYMLLFIAAFGFVACSSDDDDSPSTPKDNAPKGAEAVDLGLSVKWANMNIGATTPEGYGDYFAWGETKPKDNYDWSTYDWCKGSEVTMTKYCTLSDYGTVDNNTVLELADDAAYKNWGGSWRMPTMAETWDLFKKCSWTWTKVNGVPGWRVTGTDGKNSIFLPAAGTRSFGSLNNVGSYGSYWSSSLEASESNFAYNFHFYSNFTEVRTCPRFYGLSIRAVCP